MIGNALPNQLQRYYKICRCANFAWKKFRSCNSFKRDKVIFCLEILGNLNKQHILILGSSLVVPWFVLGFSLVFSSKKTGRGKGNVILRKCTFE